MLIKYSKTQKTFLSQKKKKKSIKDVRSKNYDTDKPLRDIENLFNSGNEDYYKPIKLVMLLMAIKIKE